MTRVTIFDTYFSIDFWEKLVDVVNRNLSINTSISIKKDSRKKMTNLHELRRFYAIQMCLENSFGNNTRNLRDHFKLVKEEHSGEIGMGFDRFSILRRNLTPSELEITEIISIVSKNSKSLISATSV